jgi:hypothetical protein
MLDTTLPKTRKNSNSTNPLVPILAFRNHSAIDQNSEEDGGLIRKNEKRRHILVQIRISKIALVEHPCEFKIRTLTP